MAQAFDRLAPLAVVLALASPLAGCAQDRVVLSLSWLLGDGLSCSEAGVEAIEVSVTSALRASSRFACEEGFAPAVVELGAFEEGVVKIEVAALSAEDTVLYRAEGLTDLHGDQDLARMQLEPVSEP